MPKDADHIIEEVKERYARLKTYRHVSSCHFGKASVKNKSMPDFAMKASLSFERPDKFNVSSWCSFSYEGERPPAAPLSSVVGNSESFKVNKPFAENDPLDALFSKFPGQKKRTGDEQDRDFFGAVAATSSFCPIPTLLCSNKVLERDYIRTPKKTLLLPDERVDEHMCFHVILYDKSMNPSHLWIDKSSYLIRRTRIMENFTKIMQDCTKVLLKMLKVIPGGKTISFDMSGMNDVLYEKIEVNVGIPAHVFDPKNASPAG
jgi:hypothetical protein